MKRMLTTGIGVALLAGCTLPIARASAPVPAATRPNIVFILTDDLDYASFFDATRFPALDSLLTKAGVSFTNYIVPDSLCCPSRASLLRGQYVHNHGVQGNVPPLGGFERWQQLGLDKSTIATWLRAGGYRTAMYGKYLNNYPLTTAKTYVPPGWDDWAGAVGNAPYNEFNYQLNENGVLRQYGATPADYLVDVLAKKAAKFITSTPATKPLFMEVTPLIPHEPATPPQRYANAFPGMTTPHPPSWDQPDVSQEVSWLKTRAPLDQPTIDYIDLVYRKRMQSMLAVGDLVQTVVNALTTSGKLDNTYIVFASDNGFHMGEHRLNPGKQTAFEEDIHVPLVVRGPGIKGGRKVNSMVREIDLAPTFAALAGVTPPAFVDGRSFAAAFTGADRDAPPDALIEHYLGTSSDVQRAPDGSLIGDPDSETFPFPGWVGPVAQGAQPPPKIPTYRALRTRQYTYVEYSNGERQLYDVKRDPYELDNIVATHSARAKVLHKRLAALATCAGATCR